MASVAVEIMRFTDNDYPGWVECRIVDIRGRAWTFQEKVPIVTADYLDADSPYPLRGTMGCVVIERLHGTYRISVDPINDYFEIDVPSSLVVE